MEFAIGVAAGVALAVAFYNRMGIVRMYQNWKARR